MSMAIPRTQLRALAFLAAAGALVVAALLGFGGGTGRKTPWFEGLKEGVVLYAASADGYDLVPGSPVKVHGVEIGSVTSVSLVHDPARPGEHVRVAILISPHGASFLKEKTVAHVERIHMGPGIPPFATPLIDLRTEGEGRLAPGSTLEMVGEETMVESFAKLSQDVGAVRKRLDDLDDVFGDVRTITKALAGTGGAAGRFLHDAGTADSLTAMIADARATTASMQKLVDDARILSGDAKPMIADMKGASQEGRRMLAQMGGATADLPRMLKAVERTLKLAEELVVNLRAASVYAPELARKVDASIEETNRMVDAAQRSVLLRSTLPERRVPKTEAEVRPPTPLDSFKAQPPTPRKPEAEP